MTLLVSFIGVDGKKDGPKPASIYIASDSRISWRNTTAKFDYGKKVFGCKNSPDIFGYCGDVLFPSIVLNQLVSIADQGLLFSPEWNCTQKFQAIIDKLVQMFNQYPSEIEGITTDSIEIIYASTEKDRSFYCQKMKWRKSTGKWKVDDVKYGEYSDKLFVAGSGAGEFLEKLEEYQNYSRTSSAIFHCFCDTLFNIKDKYCGGAPQLVGLYRKFNSQVFGIVYNNKRYLEGMEISNLRNFNAVNWRNENFEICDGDTMKIKPKAKRQPNILRN